ncbi:hypothetical protein [Pantoea sp. Acro-807]|uniref:hypothetical protein n=1 Tax=Pantoea sp. Acro-807 TaxID=2608356 RepID=UPI001FFD276C|nr:hypothetical protein [Pantoea sp. Acro-807]
MNLGYAYLNGEGVEMNYAKARNWLEIAGKQGQPSAMYHPARCTLITTGLLKTRSWPSGYSKIVAL